MACTRARDLLVIPRPPVDAALGDFWRDLIQRLPAASDDDVEIVDAETLPIPEHASQRAELWALAGAEGGDAVAARWEAERRERARETPRCARSCRSPPPASRPAPLPRRPSPPATGGGRDFGSLVHRLLEWAPLEAEDGAGPSACGPWPRPSPPPSASTRRPPLEPAEQVAAALGLPLLRARAPRAPGCGAR